MKNGKGAIIDEKSCIPWQKTLKNVCSHIYWLSQTIYGRWEFLGLGVEKKLNWTLLMLNYNELLKKTNSFIKNLLLFTLVFKNWITSKRSVNWTQPLNEPFLKNHGNTLQCDCSSPFDTASVFCFNFHDPVSNKIIIKNFFLIKSFFLLVLLSWKLS